MGAWGLDSFENDQACDWASDLIDSGDIALVAETLQEVAEAAEDDDYLDSDDACNAIAAAEVVARAQGAFGQRDAYTEDLDAWIEKQRPSVSPKLRQLALRALERVIGPDSELRELWADSGPKSLNAWLAKINDLKARVGA